MTTSTASTHATHDQRYDVEAVRRDFPTLRQEVKGYPLAYLDNGATSQKPQVVIDRLRDFYEQDNANVHRGVHALSERATLAYEAVRAKVQGFLNAALEKEIVFVSGTTEGLNLVAHCHVRPMLQAGDEILITEMEHHSNIVPWQMLCKETGAILKVIPINDDGELVMEKFHELLGPRTKFVSVVYVANSLGTVNPVKQIIDAAHALDITVMLDGAQAVSHGGVDVQALDCDFFTFSSHKVFGPTGIGALYGKADLLEAMPPYKGGGDMIRTVSFEETVYADVPLKFEAGTPNIADTIAMGTALDYLQGLGLERVAAYEKELLAYATEAVSQIPGIRLIGTAREKASILSFVMDGAHAHDVGTILDGYGVAVRTGHHCTQPVMKRFGVAATTRASLALYNNRTDIDALVSGLHRVAEIFKR
ncbi:MAG: cysteine desulfurase/selenocysteine lyase [Gammaproteobacteria bacterium]|jgi:cysteine desulfurase/selenocysteine lyase